MKYDVHLYIAVRTKLEGIEAASQAEAVRIANEELDVKSTLANCAFEDDEAPALGAYVDECGDEQYIETTYHQLDGALCYLHDDSRKAITAAPGLQASLAACLQEIDAEIEQRKTSGIDEYWQGLQAISDAGHAAIKKATTG